MTWKLLAAAVLLPVMTPVASIASERLETLYRFINENSPEYHMMYPDNDLVGKPKYHSDMVKSDPRIVIVTDGMLQDMKLSGHGTADALYEVETATIYLSDHVNLDTVHGRSVLLHELVHHVQHQTDLEAVACGHWFVEGDAYSVQAEYLKEHGYGHDDRTLTGIRGMGILHSSMGERCLLDLIMNGQ